MLEAWAQRLKELRFRDKMRALSLVVAGAFALVLLVNLSFGLLNGVRLRRIEVTYYPSVVAGRTLQETVASVRRGLQDAAAAADLDHLHETDSLRTAYLAVIDAAVESRTIDSVRARELQEAFVRYYGLARGITVRLVNGESGDALVAGLQAMRARHIALVSVLDAHTAGEQDRIRIAFADARAWQRFGWTLTALITLGTLAAVLWLSRVVTRSVETPLRDAVRAADALALGDMDIDVTVASADEIGQLMQSLQRMIGYLRDMSTAAGAIAMGDTAVRVTPRSSRDAFGNAFDGMRSALEERAQVATAMAAGDLSLRLAPRSTADTFGHAFTAMTTRISEVIGRTLVNAEAIAASAARLSDSSRHLSESAAEQTTSLDATREGLRAVRTAFAHNADSSRRAEALAGDGAARAEANGVAMEETAKAMETILTHLALIDNVAAQASLLSINASIEAARAGDYGRGFAVVANEMGVLAEQSQASAKQIGAVTTGTREAVARSTGLLEHLVGSIRETAERMRMVAAVSGRQEQALEEVNRTLEQVDGIARRNAAAADGLAKVARDLAEQAASLALVVNYFHVAPDTVGSAAPTP
jgi:methyl-accepting chemotaxis protein